MTETILLLGSGGRECALAWKISQSPLCGKLYIAPGNGGTMLYGTNVPELSPMDFEAVLSFCRRNSVTLLVVGNEDPLVGGIRNYFATHGGTDIAIVGPGADGASLEGSKDFAKRFMAAHDIPTAAYRSFNAETADEGCRFLETLTPPYVLKADGLAAGKGVLIIDDLKEAQASLRQMLGGMFGKASATVVVEEFMDGIECSVFVLTDGTGNYRILPVAKDYKRIGEGDTGLNTGGMGAVSPVVFADSDFMAQVEQRIVRPTVRGLIDDGIDYRGFIFLGLIKIRATGQAKVIEYNVRMGDPETEVVMLRLASDLVPLLRGVADGNLGDIPADTDPRAACTVMAVAGGYPGKYAKGDVISGNLQPSGSVVFHAGTRCQEISGTLLTNGGRVLAVSSYGDTVSQALERSYRTLADIDFRDKYYRRDIGRDLLALGAK